MYYIHLGQQVNFIEKPFPIQILLLISLLGNPKGVVRDTGGYATVLKWSMNNVFGMNPGDTFWAASDVGWVVGHSYIAYGSSNPLLVILKCLFSSRTPSSWMQFFNIRRQTRRNS